MASQLVVADLEKGDRVQVYMYTHTGLMDKKSNWFTHFVGLFLRCLPINELAIYILMIQAQELHGSRGDNSHPILNYKWT